MHDVEPEKLSVVHTLPLFRLTTVQRTPDMGTLPVDYLHGDQNIKYWRKPISANAKAQRWSEFRLFPLILDREGAPWQPACMWLLERAQANPHTISSLRPIAQDLAAYKNFLDDFKIEWDDFSEVIKYLRPTYLYHTHLQGQVTKGSLKRSTAARRMSTVIGFYNFLDRNKHMRFSPANPTWIEKKISIAYNDSIGRRQVTNVRTTDISIKSKTYEDASSGTINDGAKLRPLTVNEQKELVNALKKLGNTEYSLMHYIALLTGAREMTVLTLRLGEVLRPTDQVRQWPHKILCGPGTRIDTKGDIGKVYLSMPRELYEQLHAYAVSERARRRRAKTQQGEDPMNYLFLTQHGQPYYESREDLNAIRDSSTPLRRSALSGRPLRKFIQVAVTPLIQESIPGFTYRFHDLRATFGMNWVDYQMQQAGNNGIDSRYDWILSQLSKLMWHRSTLTTEKYLKYREQQKQLEQAKIGWSEYLSKLINTEK
ncbi:integrase [Comamonas sp.]|uniref:integrase n=1 Tax=Comamonas sp. TaxID=34028 RepID=UPI0012C696B4|nr:integrase [Comamonas sp.]MPS87137.1 site-specific integrase [Comamonas sp.]MPT13029.1 site-specific integrase [Comamonas sp.]